MAYQKDRDYQAEINQAVANGDYASASKLEKERNEKIDGEGLSYEKTNKYTKLNGEDDATYNQRMSTYNQSEASKVADKETEEGLLNLKSLSNQKNIIGEGTWSVLSRNFNVPNSVKAADSYLQTQLEKIQSGKTSYSDQVRDMMDKIMNREKFSYDVDTDPLFQQALASAMNSGKQAMQDTIGQASALTGGYGSTYATTAGNQAYNAYIEDAYDNLPQYYQMAMEAYQMEGDELYRQYGMLYDADSTEYNRNVTAYDATYQHRNRMYDEAYTQFRDSKADAISAANLRLNEYDQKVDATYNYYNATSNYADSLYEREYTKWADAVNNAYKNAELLNSDWWNQTNFDENVRQFDKTYEQNDKFHSDEMGYKYAALAQDQSQFEASLAEDQRQFDITTSLKKSSGGSGGGSGSSGGGGSIPNDIAKKAASIENDGERFEYIAKMVDLGYLTDEQADYLINTNQSGGQLPLTERTWTMIDNGGVNGGWGIDKNGVAEDQYGNKMSMEDIYNELKKTMGKDAAETYVIELQNRIGITDYKW